jgi:predicted lactoylglutathione lyase
MTKQLWLNLPVKDLEKSKQFFSELGFSFNTEHGNSPVSASLVVGKNVLMLFDETSFKNFTKTEVADTAKSNEILISIDAESREEVDAFAEKVTAAGGTIFAKPSEKDGWMYGFGFTDLDGHRWNILYMDMSKMPNP